MRRVLPRIGRNLRIGGCQCSLVAIGTMVQLPTMIRSGEPVQALGHAIAGLAKTPTAMKADDSSSAPGQHLRLARFQLDQSAIYETTDGCTILGRVEQFYRFMEGVFGCRCGIVLRVSWLIVLVPMRVDRHVVWRDVMGRTMVMPWSPPRTRSATGQY